MAQWIGQFIGRTHGAAVTDAEQLLLHAVGALKSASVVDRPRKMKAVRALAKRLYSARAHFLKTRVKSATELAPDKRRPPDPREVARLQEALNALTSGGVAAILAEFEAVDGCSTSE
jgi:hypothetical protein